MNIRNTFALIIFAQAAFSADQNLLNLVMPDAKVIAGVQVDQAKVSRFGKFVLSHMQPDDASFKKFMADTHFDPRQDLSEIVMASNWQSDATGRWLMVARGRFDTGQIAAAVVQNGGARTNFQGIDLLSGGLNSPGNSDSVIAFLDAKEAAMGDPDSVKAAIQRYQTKAAGTQLPAKIQDLSGKYDFWFLTLVPLSEFAGLMPDGNMNQAMKGNLFQAIQQASGGMKFGKDVQIAAECVARSDKDAAALVDVVRFIAGLIQTNKDKNATSAQVSTLVDNMNLNSTGNVMTMSLAVPETLLEQILNGSRAEKGAAKK